MSLSDAIHAYGRALLDREGEAAAQNDLREALRDVLYLGRLAGASEVVGSVRDDEPEEAVRAFRRFPARRFDRLGNELPKWTLDALLDEPPSPWDAIEALLAREPILATTAEEVMRAVENGSFAALGAATQHVAEEVRDRIVKGMSEGKSRDQIAADIVGDTGWAESYAQTVYRTNVTRAYSDGVKAMGAKPELAGAVAAYEFSATMDSDTRPNHAAANGFTAQTHDTAWHTLEPPLGFNCRCRLRAITRQEAMRRGMDLSTVSRVQIPAGAGPDEGFARRGGPF